MSGPALEVVKIGGSLLSRPDFTYSLTCWLEGQPSCARLLVVGGGEIVNELRNVHSVLPLRDASAHWLAIEAMDLQARRIHGKMPQLRLVYSLDGVLRLTIEQSTALMLCREFLEIEEPELSGTKLPIGWQVTSDSIAARLAVCLGARLRLLKSREANPAELANWRFASKSGLVDHYFANLAPDLPFVTIETLPTYEAKVSFVDTAIERGVR